MGCAGEENVVHGLKGDSVRDAPTRKDVQLPYWSYILGGKEQQKNLHDM